MRKIRLILTAGVCFLFAVNQKVVFGYAYDTTYKTNCANCHTLRKAKVKAGSWAVRKDIVREMESTESNSADRWACDICHQSQNTNKLFDFSLYDTSMNGGQTYINTGNYPSAHPVPVFGKNPEYIRNQYRFLSNGTMKGPFRSIMYCTNCHDPLQVGRGIHKSYISIYRLRFSGLDSAGVQHFDPDPSDDGGDTAARLGNDSTSWFWTRPFDSADSGSRGYLKFGLIPHSGDTTFDPRNPRDLNKERTNFDTLGMRTIYFCATCHDYNGFPQDPLDTSDSVSDTSARRIRPPDFAEGISGYDASDANDSFYTPADGGHTIQAKDGTNNGLKTGDKLPCVDCHDSHSSRASRRLIKEKFTWPEEVGFNGVDLSGGIQTGIEKAFCKKCHNKDPNNAYYPGGTFTKYGAAATSDLLPFTDSKGGRGPMVTDAHWGNSRRTCYSFFAADQDAYYVNGGCHRDPHRPTMFCNGCHPSHFDTGSAASNRTHPVGVMLTSTPLPGDTMSIKDYYTNYADTMEVQIFGGANGYYNGYIDCYTCHNDHSLAGETTYSVQAQGLLRGDAGPLDSTNNYPNHDTNYNEKLRPLVLSGGGVTDAGFNSMKAMPELCINCHLRVVGVKFGHGGFAAGAFGQCDKCHSIHGQHPEPAKNGSFDSSTLVRNLQYGMYLDTGAVTPPSSFDPESDSSAMALFNSLAAVNRAYSTVKIAWDLNETGGVHTTYVYQDSQGKWFSYRKNDHLIHEKKQEFLCVKCHGNPKWSQIVDTTSGQKPPPQVFFDTTGLPALDSLDMYYTSYTYDLTNRNKTSHPVDLPDSQPPGYSMGGIVALKCGSGTKGSGCHNPHGNNNFAQVNALVLDSSSYLYSTAYGSAVVPYNTVGGAFTTRSYVSGMSSFCSLCHDLFGCNIYNPDSTFYDTVKGHLAYTRHPAGNGISVLNLYDSADRGQMDSAFFSNLILDYDTNSGTGYPSGRPTYNDFLTADTAKAAKNFIVTCITCHRQHGSPNLHLRKFTDKGVVECVGCHSKSPDILK